MKKIFLLTLLISNFSFADYHREVLTCVTTEPFISYTLDAHEGTLVFKEAVMDVTKVVSSSAIFKAVQEDINEYGYIKLGSKYEVVDSKTGKKFLELTYDNEGSNGMSETIYPFSAKFLIESSNDYTLFGGCYSINTPAQNPNLSIYKLKDPQ